MSSIFERIMEAFPEETFVRWNDLDAAIIGLETKSMRVIYSVTKIHEELVKQGMSQDDAFEWYGRNIECCYVGERTPIHCEDLF